MKHVATYAHTMVRVGDAPITKGTTIVLPNTKDLRLLWLYHTCLESAAPIEDLLKIIEEIGDGAHELATLTDIDNGMIVAPGAEAERVEAVLILLPNQNTDWFGAARDLIRNMPADTVIVAGDRHSAKLGKQLYQLGLREYHSCGVGRAYAHHNLLLWPKGSYMREAEDEADKALAEEQAVETKQPDPNLN